MFEIIFLNVARGGSFRRVATLSICHAGRRTRMQTRGRLCGTCTSELSAFRIFLDREQCSSCNSKFRSKSFFEIRAQILLI